MVDQDLIEVRTSAVWALEQVWRYFRTACASLGAQLDVTLQESELALEQATDDATRFKLWVQLAQTLPDHPETPVPTVEASTTVTTPKAAHSEVTTASVPDQVVHALSVLNGFVDAASSFDRSTSVGDDRGTPFGTVNSGVAAPSSTGCRPTSDVDVSIVLRGSERAALKTLREKHASMGRKLANCNARIHRLRDAEEQCLVLRLQVQTLEARFAEEQTARRNLQTKLKAMNSQCQSASSSYTPPVLISGRTTPGRSASAQAIPTAPNAFPDELLKEFGAALRRLSYAGGFDSDLERLRTLRTRKGRRSSSGLPNANSDLELQVREVRRRCAAAWRTTAVQTVRMDVERNGQGSLLQFGIEQRKVRLAIGDDGTVLCTLMNGSYVPLEFLLLLHELNFIASQVTARLGLTDSRMSWGGSEEHDGASIEDGGSQTPERDGRDRRVESANNRSRAASPQPGPSTTVPPTVTAVSSAGPLRTPLQALSRGNSVILTSTASLASQTPPVPMIFSGTPRPIQAVCGSGIHRAVAVSNGPACFATRSPTSSCIGPVTTRSHGSAPPRMIAQCGAVASPHGVVMDAALAQQQSAASWVCGRICGSSPPPA